MQQETSLGWLVGWFVERGALTPERASESLDMFGDRLIDSFGVVELIADIEERYDIAFEDHHFQDRRFATLGGLAAMIDEIRAGAGRTA